MPNNPETSLGKTPVGPSTIVRVLNSLMDYEPEKIILFGSAARGETDEHSDIDLVLIKQTDKRFVQRLVEAGAFIPLDVSVDVFVYTPEEFQSMIEADNPFIEQVLQDGKVLYEKSPGSSQHTVSPSSKIPAPTGRSGLKKPLETARRWLAQAEHSLNVSHLMLDSGMGADACFHAEQTAQLALKAFLYARGRRFVNIHSDRTLAQECSKEDNDFLPFVDAGTILDRYYLSTRYPDALPEPAIPFESFTQQEATQAVSFAEEIVGLVRTKIPDSSPASTQ